ncbi:TetR/AcrR family transcriptional regulator [Actinoplanes sp. NPDC020271]|uniref:TetR/AcrR family transcriptional regulator n=1 Tax=Actinoplanes sp. NPDC020271 TaxID=3363896 RepID=UPI0037967F1D
MKRTGVRARMREAIRAELVAATIRSIDEVGFAATTGGAVAAAVGVSERTFFRYFATKEDAVLQPIEDLGPSIAAELRRRPAEESPLRALRAAFDVAVGWVTAEPRTMATVMRLNRSEPALRGRHLKQQDAWVGMLAEAMAERLGQPRDSPDIRMLCAVMMLCWERSLVRCFDRDDFSASGEELNAGIDELRAFFTAA